MKVNLARKAISLNKNKKRTQSIKKRSENRPSSKKNLNC